MKFKEWFLKEMTSTANIAAFKRISIPLVRRKWPPSIATMFDQDPPGEKKKIKMQPQVKEYAWDGDSDLWNNKGIGGMRDSNPVSGRMRGKPPETQNTVPPPGEEHGFPLKMGYGAYNIFQRYHEGQGDPLYAVLSRRGNSVDWVTVFVSPEELERVNTVAHEIIEASQDKTEVRVAENLLKQINPELY